MTRPAEASCHGAAPDAPSATGPDAPPTTDVALAALRAASSPRGGGLDVPKPEIDALAKGWRAACPDLAARLALAEGLWATGLREPRLAAAHLLVQARIPGDAPAWALILRWVEGLDDPIVADEVAKAGARRLVADPSRLDAVAPWADAHRPPEIRRAALAFTLPWSKTSHPSSEDLARRKRVLDWAGALAGAPERRVRNALSAWLRSLAKRDPERVRAFLATHDDALAPPVRREVAAVLR